jgi:hypothetical protein
MNSFKNYLIVILITVIIALYKCNDRSTIVTDIDTIETVTYIHDTIKLKGKTVIKPVPEIRWVHDTIIDSTGKQVIVNVEKYTTKDTFVYVTDSFSITFYSNIYSSCPLDSLNHDLVAAVRHKIIEREIIKQIVRKHAFFAGTSIALSKRSSFLMLDGLYEYNSKTIYNLGLGLNNNLQPVIKAGIYWNINKK